MEHLTLSLALLASSLGYLFGSVPFGLLLTKMAGLGDIRSIGSGNIGATNVLRTGNKKVAALTLLADMLKATVAVLFAAWLAPSLLDTGTEAARAAGLLAGASAFLGHLYPVWLGFKGGKGVATYLGMLIGAAPLVALVFAAFWLATASLSRYSSLAALCASIVSPFAAFIISGDALLVLLLIAMTLLLIWKHRDNIERLLTSKESKIGQKAG